MSPEAGPVVVGPTMRRGSAPLLATLPFVTAAGPLTWWAVGGDAEGDYTMVGPFDVPAWVEPTVVGLGWGLLVVAVVVLAVPKLRRGPRLAALTIGMLTVAAVVAALGWRAVTLPVYGANIGGGLAVMFAPPLLGVLVGSSVVVEFGHRDLSWRVTLASVAMVGVSATGLWALAWHAVE